jgi:hypothetical protein
MAVAFTRSETPGTEEATLFYGNERDADTLSIKEDGIRPTEERNQALFAWETRSLLRRRILQLVIGVLGIVIIVFIILAFKLSTSDTEYSYLGTARFKANQKHIDFKNAANEFVLTAKIGIKLSTTLEERHTKSKSRAKYVNSDGATLILTQETDFVLSVNWSSLSKEPTVFLDCFKLSKAHWYGGSELLFQEWPLEKAQVNMGPYVPQSISRSRNKSAQTFGPVLERYWLSSRGVAIIVDASVPLHVSINASNDGQLCLKSDTTGYLKSAVSYLGYRVLSGYNPRDLHLTVVEKFLGKPSAIPDKALIKKPSWILGNDSDNISQNSLDSFSDKISNSTCGFVVINSEHFEKNGKAEPQAGWLSLSELPSQVRSLKKLCNISLYVHPYLKVSSGSFFKVANKGYFIKDCGGKVPGLFKWTSSLAACIDVTSESSKSWFKKTLVALGYDSFEFHGGDVNHLPSCYEFYNETVNPGYFSSKYAKFAANMNGLNVHVGHQTQTLPIFVRMTTKDPTWSALKTLIPTVLTYGIMGYPYVLPSVIGGHHGDVSEELYIRWMQVTTFLPGMQFEVDKAPWRFREQTKNIYQSMLKLRESLSPVILDAFTNVTITGAPIIRPLWWVAPRDSVALRIDSQFMLGDTYLVAPVLEQLDRAEVKNVYLPAGLWQEQFGERSVVHKSKAGWMKYSVKDLKIVPYFKCLALY